MQTWPKTRRWLAALGATALVSLAGAQVTYTLTQLPTLGGGSSWAYGLNGSGQVVGVSYLADNVTQHAFFYSSGGGMVDLGSFGGNSSAYHINSLGQIAGMSYQTGGLSYHGFLYSAGTGLVDLGTLGGTNSIATGINNSGLVVGYSNVGTKPHAFTFVAGVGLVDLGLPLGSTKSYANAVNASGQIAGYILLPNLDQHAIIISGGVATDLGTLGGTMSHANAINATGQIVGYSMLLGNVNSHAFLYSSGLMTDLGTLPGGQHSLAQDINTTSQIVGWSYTVANTTPHAFLYSGGTMQDLNTLVNLTNSGFLSLDAATGINDSGQIVGYGQVAVGTYAGFLLTPVAVPEPSTWTYMLLAGFLGFAFRHYGRLASKPAARKPITRA